MRGQRVRVKIEDERTVGIGADLVVPHVGFDEGQLSAPDPAAVRTDFHRQPALQGQDDLREAMAVGRAVRPIAAQVEGKGGGRGHGLRLSPIAAAGTDRFAIARSEVPRAVGQQQDDGNRNADQPE